MSRFCKNCGAELQDEMLVCPNCGAAADTDIPEEAVPAEVPAAEAPAQPPKKARKVKWWMVAIPVVLVFAIVGALVWQPLQMRISPKKALSSAMEKTNEKLDARTDGSPLAALGKGAGWYENGELALKADASVGTDAVSAEIRLQSDRAKQQLAANANIHYAGQALSAGLYADADQAALSLNQFMNGTYYGIRYDSFVEDLKKSALGANLTEEDLAQIDAVMEKLRELSGSTRDPSKLLEPYAAIIEEYKDSLTVTHGKAEIQLDDQIRQCDTMTMTMDQASLFKLCSDLLDELEEDDDLKAAFSSILEMSTVPADWDEFVGEMRDALEQAKESTKLDAKVTYYLYKGCVVDTTLEMNVEVDGEEVALMVDINYGADPGTSDIRLNIEASSDGERVTLELVDKVERDGDTFRETITCHADIPETGKANCKITMSWNRKSGDLSVGIKAEDTSHKETELTFDCKLEELENGFRISAQGSPEALEGVGNLSVELSCTTGTQIKVPEIVNLDQWDQSVLEALEELVSSLFPSEVDPEPDFPEYPDFPEADFPEYPEV